MSQVIKIKRGGISGISGASTVKGELIIATGSLGNNASGPFLLAHGDSLGLVAGAVFTGSSVPTITDSELNGILFYDSANSRFMRLDSAGNQALNIAATGFTGDTDDVSEGTTNLYFTNARADTRIAAASVTDLTDVSSAGSGIIITAGERTQLTTAAAFTASLDADLTTFSVPASTTISAFGKTLVDDADAATARGTIGVDAAGTDNSTDVTLAGRNYLTLSGQQITAGTIDNDDLANDGITIAGVDTSLGGIITAATILGAGTTANLDENTNLYYTDARVKTKLNTENVISSSAQVSIAASQVTEISNLTADEGAQLENINSVTISNTQWGYLGGQDQAVTTTDSPTFAGLTVTGNASIQGTLTTVNSNDVNIGDRIITLNTADGAGDAGIQVHDTNGAQTGSLLWDTDGNYWKVGVVGSTDYRLVEWDGETAGAGDFIVTNADGRIDALNTSTAGDLLQSDGDGTFTVSNTIDGGSY